MKRAAVLSFCVLLLALLPAHAEDGARPVSQAEPAEITVDPLPAGRRLIRLPGVEIPLRLAPACPDDLALQSLLISIADTRRSFAAADFEATAEIDARMQIPARQIGPIAVDEFCIADSETSSAAVNISDAFTAHVSVRCGNESRQAVSYDTLALDIRLLCRLPGGITATDSAPTAAGDPAGSDAQEASSATVRF